MTNPDLDQVAVQRLSQADRVFTSDLSVDEFLLLDNLGFEPSQFVMGTSTYHIGWQTQQRMQSQELAVLTAAMYHARENAMARMQAEVGRDGASGVIGVRFGASEWVWGPHTMEFYTSGTAVRKVGEVKPMRPAPVVSMS
jgi:uncharacterized protein YbjQ (UPF0145 family)